MIPIIKAMGGWNEKRKSGRKRGEAQSGSAAAPARPRRVLSGLRIILGGESGADVCLLLGVPSEARDALPRRQPRQGTAGAHLYQRLLHIFMDTGKMKFVRSYGLLSYKIAVRFYYHYDE